ncbi:7,8-didemethyl-8-hydroxy-5-deazariboflavin synthase subunit CofG [Methanoplanus endosymbiosus]|uniref:7,8-didemethyl-8-hydroxy-5-deazariboflavin synthase n=1 Tax=Methanoplanus endosymbiosus TaxID=33865 RepID=A0A9E7PNE9_9EURY|nr:7,8-didemethyl-8-hydroxy-5-deazariboflavin synthase subunit CofG [Methanoplanus endosymbiosus]UUX93484.1 7,8-didemethyl-8-hydroxy-5-deazariboflavin synthase subunit CofG [Methanoplanus endosymbiosus]
MQQRVITYSRNAFLPLTSVCRNRCGYCTFRRPVGDGCVMAREEAERVLEMSASAGCTEALFTFGEMPEQEAGFIDNIEKQGFSTVLEYCYHLSERAIEYGMLPHTNAGVLEYDDLEWLSEVNASMGLMLETTAEIPAHKNCPGKRPEVRIECIENAGKLRIPFTTGLLLGIGETESDREESFEVIAGIHKRYGHIQEVIIQNFCPKEGTAMERWPVIGSSEICETIKTAKEILPRDIAVQIPPNLADASRLIGCGVDDLGGVSPVTIDYVNPEHPWPAIDELKVIAGDRGIQERLCIYQKYIRKGWYPSALSDLIDKLGKDIQQRNEINSLNNSQ